jgi:electron transport complex protein RnfC
MIMNIGKGIKKLYSFHGGIYPKENKYSADCPIENMPLPKRAVIPVIQNSKEKCKPIVSRGNLVIAGQKITEPLNKISVPSHSPVSGKVIDIHPIFHPLIQKPVDSIIVDSDGKDQKKTSVNIHDDYFRYSPKDLVSVIYEAGITGLGGSCFPAHVKLSPPRDTEIDVVVVNGTECEPYLTGDDQLMQEKAKEIIEGAKIIMYILNAPKCVIAIEDNKPKAIEIIKNIIFHEPNISLAVLKTHFPQGSEKQLIKTLFNKEVPKGQFSHSIGIVVDNAATCYAVCRAVKAGESLISRVITVSGKGIKTPKNINVRLGTPLKDIAAFCGGTNPGFAHAVMGGPMSGVIQSSLDVPVVKGTLGVIFLTKDEMIKRKYSDCFRCGRCIRACPAKLFPNQLSIFIENNRIQESVEFNPSECIECGCCSYVCPANRPIFQQIKTVKNKLEALI